jgi:TolB protein
VNWDGSNLGNLTEGSVANDAHPSWSPDGKQIVFDSDRSGTPQLYIMNADGSSPRALTNDTLQNTEPKWSPDGKWIAYHCRQGFDTSICVIRQMDSLPGSPSPDHAGRHSRGRHIHLAFLCFQEMQSILYS